MFHPRGPTLAQLLVQGLSSLERGYDLLAPRFDFTPFRTPDAVLQPVARLLSASGGAEAALDVCCGTGAALVHLQGLTRRRLAGVDVSGGMLEQARAKLAALPGGPPLELHRGDARALGFREEFDLVTCFGAFGHFLPHELPQLVDGVARALVPGGRFAFVTLDTPSPLRPGVWLARAFNAAMHVRNALWRPRFVMYYLTFLLPEARRLLQARGLRLQVHEGLFPAPYQSLLLVVAQRER